MTGMGDAFGAQLRAAKAEGELARIKDELREFAEENGFNPEMEPRDLLAKAAGAFRSCAAVSDARYAEIQGLRAEMEAMRPRLMPVGMQWPRDAKGVPIVRGDTVWANGNGHGDGRAWHVRRVSPGLCYPVEAVDAKGEKRDLKAHWLTHERPAPKVLDADGVECSVGDAVWWVHNKTGNFRIIRIEQDGKCAIHDDDADEPCGMTVPPIELTHKRPVLDADGVEIRKGDTVYQMGCKYRVSHLHGANDYVRIVYENSGRWVDMKTLTHRAPVLAADGKPLREGETVWSVDSGTRYTVEKVTDELIPIRCCSEMGSTVSLHPSQLTHERPDSWERWRREWMLPPCDYCKRVLGIEYDHEMQLDDAFDAQGDDLVRRARAMAGVE